MSDTWHARPPSQGALFKVGSRARGRALNRHSNTTAEERAFPSFAKKAHRAAVRLHLRAIIKGAEEVDSVEPASAGDFPGYT